MDLFPFSLWDEDFTGLEDLEDMLFSMSMASLAEREEKHRFRSRRQKRKQQKRLIRTQALQRREVRSRRKLILEEENQHKQAEPLTNIISESSSASSDTEILKLDPEKIKNVAMDFCGPREENIGSWCSTTESSDL